MSRKTRKKSSAKSVGEMLPEFRPNARRRMGSSDSAHKVAIGEYKGRQVAIKPFRSKSGITHAERELRTTREALKRGFQAFEPIEIMNLRRYRVALLLSRYVPDLAGAHTLSIEADPESPQGRAVAAHLGRVSSTLGRLHGERITHGDPLLKNFAFVTPRGVDLTTGEPYVYDFEKGAVHDTNRSDFREGVAVDINKLMYSLGTRQFGGADDGQAAELAREAIVLPYIMSPATEELANLAMAQLIDSGQASFASGRENKKLPEPRHLTAV